MKKGIFIVAATILMLSSCATVSEYQRMYINDSDMELSLRTAKKFEHAFQLYREGAAGATGGKSGGGCGCN